MVIKVGEYKGDDCGMYSRLVTEIKTEEGSESMTFGQGEPEDNVLYRDLSDAYSIKNALILAYKAGQNNEILKIEENILEE